MPGIFGLVTRMPRERAEADLRLMLNAMVHGSFYATAILIDESLGVYAGCAAPAPSFAGVEALRNDRGDVAMLFAGEEYSRPRGYRACGDPKRLRPLDTLSYLIRQYERDRAFPAALNGRFQGLVVDRPRERVALFNDRWGMHRVYYRERPAVTYFAAEAKAILAVAGTGATIDARGLGELISCGCVLEDRTVFEGIHVLPPASLWFFRHAEAETKRRYFTPEEWEGQSVLGAARFYRELRGVFPEVLARHFESGGDVGLSLTGGLDTRMIAAWDRSAAGSVPAYSFGSELRDSHDVRTARMVARHRGHPYQVIRVGREFLSDFPSYATRAVYLSDGGVGVDRAPDVYVSEQARAIAPVRMTGNYGGEILRRVRAFKPVPPRGRLFSGDVTRLTETAAATYAAALACHWLTFAISRQVPWHHSGILALEQTQLSVRSPFLDNDVVRLMFRAPAEASATTDVCLRLIADGDEQLARIPTDRGLRSGRQALRAALMRGLREFSVKAEYAYDAGMPQWLAAIDHVIRFTRPERLFLGRHKFAHFRLWYRGPLAAVVQEILLDRRALERPYLNRRVLEHIVGEHVGGTRNHTDAIHQLLTLELLHRVFVDSPVSGGPQSGGTCHVRSRGEPWDRVPAVDSPRCPATIH